MATMVWAWPGLRARYFPHHRTTLVEYLKPLKLTPQQVSQVQAVYKETGQRSHEIYLQFVPQYTKICEDFTATRKQERDAFEPVRQQELSKLQAIMTPAQWQQFQQMRAQSQRGQPQRQPDVCRHLPGAPPASTGGK